MNLQLVLPPPHRGQATVARDPARFGVVIAGRRWGKTLLGVARCCQVGGAGGQAMWTAPTWGMTKVGWEPMIQIARSIPGATVRLSDREVHFPSGGRVLVRSADNPDTIRGVGLDFTVLDEAAYMKPDAWREVLRPALADRKGSALFISTPAGYNWLYDLHQAAEGGLEGWSSFQYPTSTNPYIDPTELDAARREMGSHQYAQEFDAQFVEAGGGIIKLDWLRSRYTLLLDGGDLYYVIDGEPIAASDCWHFGTVDLAISEKQTADYTVFGAFAVTPDNRMLVIDIYRARMDAPLTIQRLAEFHRVHDLDWVGIEDVAYQKSAIQYARREGMAVRPLSPHGKDKRARALPLIARLEAGDVYLPDDADWLGDLEREALVFPAGAHDDQIDVLAYAAREVFAQGLAYTGPLGV